MKNLPFKETTASTTKVLSFNNLLAFFLLPCSAQATENLGMVMVFTLVSAAQEYLNEKRDAAKQRREKEREEQEEAARKAAEVLKHT